MSSVVNTPVSWQDIGGRDIQTFPLANKRNREGISVRGELRGLHPVVWCSIEQVREQPFFGITWRSDSLPTFAHSQSQLGVSPYALRPKYS